MIKGIKTKGKYSYASGKTPNPARSWTPNPTISWTPNLTRSRLVIIKDATLIM